MTKSWGGAVITVHHLLALLITILLFVVSALQGPVVQCLISANPGLTP